MTDQTINVAIGEDVINVTLEAGVSSITYVAEDVKFRFDGESGDTYLLYNSATGKLELWVDGVKRQQW